MKKFFLISCLFVFCVGCFDIIAGIIAKPVILDEPDAGTTHSCVKQSFYDKKCELLVLGASRANHHYNTKILEDEFDLSCYNAGIDGNSVLLSYVQLKAFLKRCHPKIVILDVSTGQLNGNWKTRYYYHKCHYGIQNDYSDVINRFGTIGERICMHSWLYKLNEAIPDLFESYLLGDKECTGYIPLRGTTPGIQAYEERDENMFSFGEEHLEVLKAIVNECKNQSIFLAIINSPSLIIHTNGIWDVVADFCNKTNVPFINYQSDSVYISHPEWFKDYTHLNETGANYYTKEITLLLKPMIQDNLDK